MIPKKEIWKAIRRYCKFCEGDAPALSVCEDMVSFSRCELLIFRSKEPRKDEAGMLRAEFKKRAVKRTIRSHCRRICLNNHSLKWCSDPNCHLYAIVHDGKGIGDTSKGDEKGCLKGATMRPSEGIGIE